MLGYIQPESPAFTGRLPYVLSQPRRRAARANRLHRRTATKYRNTTTATRDPAELGAALACSVTNMVVIAGSSGRRDDEHRRSGELPD